MPGSWDSDGTWDSGLEWDFSAPSTGNVAPYLELITSEHNQKPKFMAMLAAAFQPFADGIDVCAGITALFDLDTAVGEQLDFIGQWVGASRNIPVPLLNVYFSWDTVGLGWDEGSWYPTGGPLTELLSLPDEFYRTLLRAVIANNSWNGTIPDAYAAWDLLFGGTGFGILIQDYANMHMLYAITGPTPDAVTLALFTGGYLNMKPAGVTIDGYMTPATPGARYFAFDVESTTMGGWDEGSWGVVTPP